jgi:hypothetical protein
VSGASDSLYSNVACPPQHCHRDTCKLHNFGVSLNLLKDSVQYSETRHIVSCPPPPQYVS